MIDLSIIIVSFNTKDYLLKCLSSIKKFTFDKFKYEIIVVDNGSKDGSVEEVQGARYKGQGKEQKIKLITNKQNLGFSKANNIGVKEAKGRYLLFLNSDTEFILENTLEEMISFMDFHSTAAAATCFIELPDRTIDDASNRGFPTPWNSFCHFSGLGKIFPNSMFLNGYHLGFRDLDKVHEIDALAGAFMIVKREAGDQVQWWDEDYFFYGEDLDFCYKLKQIGWKIYFVPTTKVLHYKGISGGIKNHSKHISSADQQTRITTQNARFDAMRIFYRKHYKDKYPAILNKLVIAGVGIKQRLTKI